MRKSIYQPLVGKYVQVDYGDGCIVGKLIKANLDSLELQPNFNPSYLIRETQTEPVIKNGELVRIKKSENILNLEEITKRFNRKVLAIVDSSKVRSVSDITTIFRDEWKLI